MSGIGGGKSNAAAPTLPNNRFSEEGSSQSSFTNQSQDPASVWGVQAPYLQGLYGQGQQLAQNFGGYQQGAQGIYDTAVGGFNNLMNPGVSPQLEAYQRQVGQNLSDNILPQVAGSAGMAGQMGGSRQGVAEGLALSRGNQQITDMAANLYNQDMNRMAGAMQQAPGLAAMGMGIPWYALQQYAGLLGSPTVLSGGARSTSQASGSSYGTSRDTGGGGGGGGGGWNVSGPSFL
jgi:hypothetical protein